MNLFLSKGKAVRRSHQEQDAKLDIEKPALTGQPTRATQHPSKSTKSSGEQDTNRKEQHRG